MNDEPLAFEFGRDGFADADRFKSRIDIGRRPHFIAHGTMHFSRSTGDRVVIVISGETEHERRYSGTTAAVRIRLEMTWSQIAEMNSALAHLIGDQLRSTDPNVEED